MAAKKDTDKDTKATTGATTPTVNTATPPETAPVQKTGDQLLTPAQLTAEWSKATDQIKASTDRVAAIESEIASRLLATGKKGAVFTMPDGQKYRPRSYEKGPMAGKKILVLVTGAEECAI